MPSFDEEESATPATTEKLVENEDGFLIYNDTASQEKDYAEIDSTLSSVLTNDLSFVQVRNIKLFLVSYFCELLCRFLT